jgi:cysteine desulfurase
VALDAFNSAVQKAYANPGSLHQAGAAAARVVERSRRTLLRAFGADGYRVIWTATGTEGNHLGIQGMARAVRSRFAGVTPRILVGAIEHPSSIAAARALEAEGFQVELIPVDSHGRVTAHTLTPLLGEDVALVTLQWANNEIGALHPIGQLVSLVRNRAPQAVFHCDAVQAVGKCSPALSELGADCYAVAAHKLGGVRGCAAFLLREDSPTPQPLFVGGGHEGGLRSGTENTMGIAAFAAAAKSRRELITREPDFLHTRRATLLAGLKEHFPNLTVLGPPDSAEQLGAVLAIAIPGIRAETFLHILESNGVYVGSGSACNTHGHSESAVLAAVGLAPELRNSVLRISLSGYESNEQLQRTVAAFGKSAADFSS